MAKKEMTRAGILFLLVLLHSGCARREPVNEPVSERVMLDVGDHEVYLEISGQSRDAPLVLFLHGGPGSVAHLAMFQVTVGRQLEQDFLVAYLHQRGTGKSSPVPDSEQTISAHIDDLVKVVDYLTERYGQDKVHLVGHSWGGMLAGHFAVSHAENIEKLILISTAVNVKSLLRDSHEAALKWAQEKDIPQAVTELTALDQSYDTVQHFGTVLGWANQAGGTAGDFDMESFLESHNINTDYPNWREQQGSINSAMMQQVLEIDLSGSFSSLDIPALFVSGALDTIVTETTMRRDHDNYRGKKSFVLLEESHHLPFIDQPDELAQAVRTFLSE
jgi:proline-specific peptidase